MVQTTQTVQNSNKGDRDKKMVRKGTLSDIFQFFSALFPRPAPTIKDGGYKPYKSSPLVPPTNPTDSTNPTKPTNPTDSAYSTESQRLKNNTLVPDKEKCSTLSKFGGYKQYVLYPGDLRIHALGDIELVSDKHVIFESGRDQEKERANYLHSVWINSDRDAFGRPVKEFTQRTGWIPYKHRYRTQLLYNKLRNKRKSGCGCGCSGC